MFSRAVRGFGRAARGALADTSLRIAAVPQPVPLLNIYAKERTVFPATLPPVRQVLRYTPPVLQIDVPIQEAFGDESTHGFFLKPRVVVMLAAGFLFAVGSGEVVHCSKKGGTSKAVVVEIDDDEEGEGAIDLTTATENADGCVGERLCDKTRYGYASGVRQVKLWLKKAKLNDYIDADNNLVVPLPETVIKQYFGDNAWHKLRKG